MKCDCKVTEMCLHYSNEMLCTYIWMDGRHDIAVTLTQSWKSTYTRFRSQLQPRHIITQVSCKQHNLSRYLIIERKAYNVSHVIARPAVPATRHARQETHRRRYNDTVIFNGYTSSQFTGLFAINIVLFRATCCFRLHARLSYMLCLCNCTILPLVKLLHFSSSTEKPIFGKKTQKWAKMSRSQLFLDWVKAIIENSDYIASIKLKRVIY